MREELEMMQAQSSSRRMNDSSILPSVAETMVGVLKVV